MGGQPLLLRGGVRGQAQPTERRWERAVGLYSAAAPVPASALLREEVQGGRRILPPSERGGAERRCRGQDRRRILGPGCLLLKCTRGDYGRSGTQGRYAKITRSQDAVNVMVFSQNYRFSVR